MKKGIYQLPPIKAETDMEMVCDIIYFVSCYRKLKGFSTKVIRKKLVSLLALYVIHGFSDETKKKAAKVLGVGSRDINGYNHELRNQGLLIKDDNDEKKNYLNPMLQKIGEYYNQEPKNLFMFFLEFKVTNE